MGRGARSIPRNPKDIAMSQPASPRTLGRRHRLAAAVAAVAATTALLSALLVTFDKASPELWLAPSPELMEAAAACERLDSRAAREHCETSLVTARLQADQQALRIAQR